MCFREGAFAIAGGRIGKYLEQTKRIRNGAQVIERVLRETVPESQLHALLNSKNFSTTAGALGDIIEKVARGLYNLLRR